MEPQENVTTNQVEQVSTPATNVDESKKDTQPVGTENIQSETLNKSPLEGATTNVSTPEGNVTPTEDKNLVEGKLEVSDEIQKKLDRLAEYELKDKELNDLKGRLGVEANIPDNQVFSAQQQLAIVENQAQQEYIRLCNEYGVDYRPDKIDASGKELLEKDPKGFYELQFKLNGLNNMLEAKRQEVNTFVQQREFNLVYEQNKQIFETSPAISRAVKKYVDAGLATPADVQDIINVGLDVAREAYEMGRQAVLNEKKEVKPAQVLNNNTISQQVQSTPPATNRITLADVEKMDIETYKKHQKEIDKLFLS